MEHQNDENIYLKLVTNSHNWMHAFRQNIGILRSHYGWTVRLLAEKADISENTINKIVQGKTNGCDASIVVKLARAFNVSADELMGSETIHEETRLAMAMSRVLKEHNRKVIRMYVRHQYLLHSNNEPNKKYISVVKPMCKNGCMKMTLIGEKMCIEHLPGPIKEKIGFGITIPCDHYEPHFLKGETILLGFDRDEENNEMCVISYMGNIYICIKKIQFIDEKKEVNYISIINKKKIFSCDEIDDKFGYIVGFLEPDGVWGER